MDIISRPLSYLSDSGDQNHCFSKLSSRFSFSTVSLLLLEQSLWCLANLAGESEDVVYYLINYNVGDSNDNRITDCLSSFSSSSSINSSNNNNNFHKSYFISIIMNIFEIFTNQEIFLVAKQIIGELKEKQSSNIYDLGNVQMFFFFYFY
jgi:hypothetical protein